MKLLFQFIAALLLGVVAFPILVVGWTTCCTGLFLVEIAKSMHRSRRNTSLSMPNKTESPGTYIVEVYVLQGDKRVDGVVVQKWYSWFPYGNPQPSLEHARIALEAARRMPQYAQCEMRIVSGGYTLIEVSPGDAPLVQIHNGVHG